MLLSLIWLFYCDVIDKGLILMNTKWQRIDIWLTRNRNSTYWTSNTRTTKEKSNTRSDRSIIYHLLCRRYRLQNQNTVCFVIHFCKCYYTLFYTLLFVCRWIKYRLYYWFIIYQNRNYEKSTLLTFPKVQLNSEFITSGGSSQSKSIFIPFLKQFDWEQIPVF